MAVSDFFSEDMNRHGKPAVDPLARRRDMQRVLSDAREKLTSAEVLAPQNYDHELLRLFAQNRVSGMLALFVFCLGIAASATTWAYWPKIVVWVLLVTGTSYSYLALCRYFLSMPLEEARAKNWRLRFIAADFSFVSAWCTLPVVIGLPATDEMRVFLLFSLLLFGAVCTVLAASIPLIVYVGLIPLSATILNAFPTDLANNGLMMGILTLGIMVFYVFLAHRLQASAVETLSFRAQKDTLIADLEIANARSDDARKKAEAANLAKSRFLATMSHELRTPLNAILGFSEILKNEGFGPHVAPQYRDYARDIHDSGEHLLGVINEVLDLSRIEAGRMQLNEEAVYLKETMHEVRRMLELRARARGLEIIEQYEAHLPPLRAEEKALRQMLINLLGNAIKFTNQNSAITIKIGWTSTGGQYISMEDRGPGIPAHEIPVVMSNFGRGSAAIKNADQGSGLGLPIVKGLIELHDGKFILNSKIRQGTEVTLLFPASRVIEAEAPPHIAQAVPHRAAA